MQPKKAEATCITEENPDVERLLCSSTIVGFVPLEKSQIKVGIFYLDFLPPLILYTRHIAWIPQCSLEWVKSNAFLPFALKPTDISLQEKLFTYFDELGLDRLPFYQKRVGRNIGGRHQHIMMLGSSCGKTDYCRRTDIASDSGFTNKVFSFSA